MEQGYRSEVQERALVVSLQMFNLILERGVALLKAQLDNEERLRLIVGEDMQILLPAIKVFSILAFYLCERAMVICASRMDIDEAECCNYPCSDLPFIFADGTWVIPKGLR